MRGGRNATEWLDLLPKWWVKVTMFPACVLSMWRSFFSPFHPPDFVVTVTATASKSLRRINYLCASAPRHGKGEKVFMCELLMAATINLLFQLFNFHWCLLSSGFPYSSPELLHVVSPTQSTIPISSFKEKDLLLKHVSAFHPASWEHYRLRGQPQPTPSVSWLPC